MLERRPLLKSILSDRPIDLLAVSGLGSSTWDLSAIGDHHKNFCFIGAMGQAGLLLWAWPWPKKKNEFSLLRAMGNC